eukprot:4647118-Alexandrium_andersonii.AAC.1
MQLGACARARQLRRDLLGRLNRLEGACRPSESRPMAIGLNTCLRGGARSIPPTQPRGALEPSDDEEAMSDNGSVDSAWIPQQRRLPRAPGAFPPGLSQECWRLLPHSLLPP